MDSPSSLLSCSTTNTLCRLAQSRLRKLCRSPTTPTSRVDAPLCSTLLARPSTTSASASLDWPRKTRAGHCRHFDRRLGERLAAVYLERDCRENQKSD